MDTIQLGHARRVAGEPQCMRWSTLGAALPAGTVVSTNSSADELLDDVTITALLAEPTGIWVWLAASQSWRGAGERITSALADALRNVASWDVAQDDDAILSHIARDVIAHDLADFIASHGGAIEVVDVHDGVVNVSFSGACARCELAEVTLHLRLEKAIRERFPPLVEVRDIGSLRRRQLFRWNKAG